MTTGTIKPRDADVYDLLQREKQRKAYGAYSRTARAFRVSGQHVHNVEARYQPAPELAFERLDFFYPEPVKPATEPVLQCAEASKPATESTTDLQHVMSPSVQGVLHESATLQISRSASTYWSEYTGSLQVLQPRIDDGRWIAVIGLGVALDICAVSWRLSYLTGHWWLLAATVVLTMPIVREASKTLDAAWHLWRWYVAVFVLACFVVWMAMMQR